ncbi:diguanylate cyclase [Vibrio sp. SCSIO 43136]|uniref:diguanylate cyclase n=1 Tax=Vibrio sp. SCSIO 43136 TaxID=2819101 RepID=UPI00207581BA|nr:diguanylate cyclase [Vibrio sp. SCSIO 43136]USD68007.1 diguanylate cyclase [Vibrio sp. SCSIO 43136]
MTNKGLVTLVTLTLAILFAPQLLGEVISEIENSGQTPNVTGQTSNLVTPNLAPKETIFIGILAHRTKQAVTQRWQPIADYLNSRTTRYYFQILPLKYNELNLAVNTRQVSIVLTNPSHYIFLEYVYGLSSPIATITNQLSGQKIKAFGGVIFTQADNSTISTLSDLRDKRVAIVKQASLGGYQMQAFELEQFEPALSAQLKLIETGMPHDNVVNTVLSKQADAGFVRTGVLEALIEKGALSKQQIKIINEQAISYFPFISSTQLYPEWPVSVLPNVDVDITKFFLSQLFHLTPEHPVSIQSRIAGFDLPSNYTSVANILRTLHQPPFDQTQEVSFNQVWGQYRLVIIGSLLTVIILITALALLGWLNRQLQEAKDAVAKKQNDLNEVIQATRVGTWSWHTVSSKITVNQRFAEILGYSLSDMGSFDINKWQEFVHPNDWFLITQSFKTHLTHFDAQMNCEIRVKHRLGEWIWVHLVGGVVEVDKDGKPLRISGTQSDISQRKTLEHEAESYKRQLEQIANHDQLTKLFSRHYFFSTADKLFDIAQRYRQPLSFVMIDADHFKQINDTYGHQCGDKVLIDIAQFLKSNIRDCDVLARLGGEEFGILLPNTHGDSGLELGLRIAREAKQRTVTVGDHQISYGISVGVSQCHQSTKDIEQLMAEADSALYIVKDTGRGSANLYQSPSA